MSLKAQQKIESRQRILNVASRLFKKQGYEATGIDQIMSDSGLTAGAFYAHFKSKKDLFRNCLQHSFKHSRGLMLQGLEAYSGAEKNKELFRRYLSALHRDFPEKGCILPSVAAELYRESAAGALIVDYLESWAEFLATNMESDKSDSEKKSQALSMISQAVGSILLSRMVRNHSLSDKILSSWHLPD